MPNQPITPTPLPALPKSWSELTWQQLCDCWQVKLRYGGNADVARAAALLALCELTIDHSPLTIDELTGEALYNLRNSESPLFRYSVSARELAYYAKQSLPWFDFPYGDPGEKEQKDDQGNIIKERREAVRGYISNMRDAMQLPIEEIGVASEKLKVKSEKSKLPWWRRIFNGQWSMVNVHWFQLPQAACANLTWEQYRALQNIVPQLFAPVSDVSPSESHTLDLQAQFLAHILTPRSFALFDTTGGNIKIRPHYVYQYNSELAERLVAFWRKRLTIGHSPLTIGRRNNVQCSMFNVQCLYHICFQVYQTALSYYEASYPLLFGGGGKQDPLKDALTGEVGTINTIMKYQGYTKPEDVYAENLPIILDVLNTMTKEAKEIEKMNAKIKRK